MPLWASTCPQTRPTSLPPSRKVKKEAWIYLSANLGAHLGLASELMLLMSHLRVGWNDAGSPNQGFKYLWLDDEAKACFEDGAARWASRRAALVHLFIEPPWRRTAPSPRTIPVAGPSRPLC